MLANAGLTSPMTLVAKQFEIARQPEVKKLGVGSYFPQVDGSTMSNTSVPHPLAFAGAPRDEVGCWLTKMNVSNTTSLFQFFLTYA